MKLAKIIIDNFRQIEHLELDFTDALGRVRDISLLVGPNGCGKSTILEAINMGLNRLTAFGYTLELPAIDIVRYGQAQARVNYYLQFSSAEVRRIKELYRLSQQTSPDLLHHGNPFDLLDEPIEVQVSWEYPDFNSPDKMKFTFAPENSSVLFEGRAKTAGLLVAKQLENWHDFEQVGGTFIFDQQRTGKKAIPREIWNIIHGGRGENVTSDPNTILLSLAMQAQFRKANDFRPNEFKLIQERFAQICHPHQIQQVQLDSLDKPQLVFFDGIAEYPYSGLSGGQQMILLFLIRMVTEHIHQSIILIDEIELHQHPLWQQNLLYALPRMGKNNQIIATSHSSYLRRLLPKQSVIELGDLGD